MTKPVKSKMNRNELCSPLQCDANDSQESLPNSLWSTGLEPVASSKDHSMKLGRVLKAGIPNALRRQATTPRVHGWFYVRNWIVEQLLALSLHTVAPLHATLYLAP